MSFPIENKLVIGVASSALFELGEADKIFRQQGELAYRAYQLKKEKKILEKGVAFPFISRLLKLNDIFSKEEEKPVEVIFLSKNDPDTGQRVFNSIKHYNLNITRSAFLNGGSPYKYIPSFNVSLFLSANEKDVKEAIREGYAAGRVLKSEISDDADDNELRIAFDFDGVIAGDESERVYKKNERLSEFHYHEERNKNKPLDPGPLTYLLKQLSKVQKYEAKLKKNNPKYKKTLKIAIITARNAPANERVVTTLRDWNIVVDEAFFLGGIDKSRILKVLKPHIYFDDQLSNLKYQKIPSVHIPFGIRNK